MAVRSYNLQEVTEETQPQVIDQVPAGEEVFQVAEVGGILVLQVDAQAPAGLVKEDIAGNLKGVSRHQVVDVTETVPPTPGNTVVLTLDRDLQKVTQEALADQIALLRLNPPPGGRRWLHRACRWTPGGKRP